VNLAENMWLCLLKKTYSSVQFRQYIYIFWCLQDPFTSAANQIEYFDWKLPNLVYIFHHMQHRLHATVSPVKLTVCLFNNFLKNPFWPLLASNASETPRDRWHYEANAGWSACVVVLLWRKRSGLPPSMTRRRFPGVSNGRHQISSQPFFNLAVLRFFPKIVNISRSQQFLLCEKYAL